MPNYFLTRKYGFWTFAIGINIFYVVPIIITTFLGFWDNKPFTPLNLPIAIVGNITMLVVTEAISNMNFRLFNNLLDNEIILGSKNEIFERIKKILWHKGVYVLFVVFYIITNISTLNGYVSGIIGSNHLLVDPITNIVLALLFAELVWVIAAPIAVMMFFLPRQELNLDIFHSDGSMGLRPIANYLLLIALMITLVGSISLFWISESPILEYSIALLLGVIMAPIGYFVVPTIGLNKGMKRVKYNALDKLNGSLKEIYNRIESSSNVDWENPSIQNLLLFIREIENKREWPFSATGVRNLMGSFIIPVSIFLFTNYQIIVSFFGIGG
ncbi:MAG: hypothetical protein ACFFC7_25340 [Candidatus Hermodarchaeota archaeon]